MQSIFDYMRSCLPEDHSRQVTSEVVAEEKILARPPAAVLDLGCGAGRSYDFFRKLAPKSSWVGLDIEVSPEVLQRKRKDAAFVTYDGVKIPFEDGKFDFVYSHQVFEHVRHPEPLLAEVNRVLAGDGIFVGSTSQLEPYHSYSFWNYTIHGFKRIAEDAGFVMEEMRPGIDGVTLIQRSYLGRPPEMSRFFSQESPLNAEISEAVLREKKSVRIANFRKLMFCGHFIFVCRKKPAVPA